MDGVAVVRTFVGCSFVEVALGRIVSEYVVGCVVVVGRCVGTSVDGCAVVGYKVGFTGESVGEFVTGESVGSFVGESVGSFVGESVGTFVGGSVGFMDGL